jgi:carbon monoxide dehydrogenase subunit G
MEILGQQQIAAARQKVWDGLNDPDVLKACLPGCEAVERISPEEFRVIIKTAIGPLKARFQGSLKIAEAKIPESCVMQFEGQGGAVGFGKGTASVDLTENAEGTELRYEAKAQIGGKLAQVGSRLIDSVAKKMADDFFKAFQLQMAPITDALAPLTGHESQVQAFEAASAEQIRAPQNQATQTNDSQKPQAHPGESMVPAWWLFPAVVLGAVIMLAGSRWMG